ncbi:putative sugar nucleotidyl transferase [Mucilaginibacter phyllosphaerae]|uniref:Glucose-1-phosphate thymidylyltransferase n=1 Tax=Mucilaginibacter phyllosphaerae TaxID=1812349 RepID=A0A4Y8A6S7_9SPHI|nr:putative sugar nucleotidyl transferase [Mucilaginibacter phyllosphaerae]MBB3970966.1 UDP-N-acetylglucosamine diphosphorylase/glucosamine-1-phosphate N-acetyltransferase [Mucilaginibacter phyllosphaerae]TEW64102.1 glucose-1-phosphate thymidylyltransferase [Mucilaginibacter phyllosphaerae]GGH05764.1 glucose-1-phosphate thymidylyltransferase [Mucilaginibacter phyllosphaerae]
MAIILFDDDARNTLLPLTYTRPVADLRIGILTIAEKWAKYLDTDFSFITENYLQGKFPLNIQDDNIFINGSVCPDEGIVEAINSLGNGQALRYQDKLIAVKLSDVYAHKFNPFGKYSDETVYTNELVTIKHPEDIFRNNGTELRKDFKLLTQGRKSAQLSSTNTIIGNDFFAEEGAQAECCSFSTLNGPIYLAANTEVWEGTHIRGPFALCEHSQIKMGTKIYGATTIGPYCRIGGEVNNAVVWGYSSKGHEGYLGNAVIGEWCNLGADTNNSNLKNNYGEVKLWDYPSQSMRNTGLQFCGLIMADHAKSGINTMFNTGTVVGVSANVFGGGYPPNHIPDFSWGGADGLVEYGFDKMMETAAKAIGRRPHRNFDEAEKAILTEVYKLTKPYRGE